MPLGLGFGNPTLDGEGGNDCFTNLLVHFGGVSGTTSLPDSSRNGITLSANGTGAISTTHFEFGGSAYHSAGSGNYATVNSTSVAALGSGPFTVDLWFYPDVATAGGVAQSIMANLNNGGNPSTWFIFYRSTGALAVGSDVAVFLSGGTISTGAWNHAAWVRDAGNVNYLFLNGTQVATTSNSQNYSTQATAFVGHNAGAQGTDLPGYFQEVRISNVARWTASFTVPNHPYTPY